VRLKIAKFHPTFTDIQGLTVANCQPATNRADGVIGPHSRDEMVEDDHGGMGDEWIGIVNEHLQPWSGWPSELTEVGQGVERDETVCAATLHGLFGDRTDNADWIVAKTNQADEGLWSTPEIHAAAVERRQHFGLGGAAYDKRPISR
jgi:hypothetical protein